MGTVAAGQAFHAEREAAVARLGEAYSRGELSLSDFTVAVERAYAAQTSEERDALRLLPEPALGEGSRFAEHLLPGERVYWTGAPDPDRMFNPADWLAIPFTLLWAGFAVFWEATAIATGPPLFAL